MRLPELSRRHMVIIYILVFVISGLLLYKFVVSSELRRYRTSVSRYHSQQQREMRQVSRRNTLIEHYKVLEERTSKIQKLLFTEREAEDFFLKKLPKLTDQMGNKLTSMIPQASRTIITEPSGKPNQSGKGNKANTEEATSPPTKVSNKPVPVTLTGEYGNMIKLFRALEEDKKLMAISDVGVGSAMEGAGEISVRFSLNLIHAGLNTNAPSRDVMDEIVANYEASKLARTTTMAAAKSVETTEEPVIVASEPRRPWYSSILDTVLRRGPKKQSEPKEVPEPKEMPEPEKKPEAGTELVQIEPKQQEDLAPRQPKEYDKVEPVKKVTKRYSVQVGVFDIESNVKELGDLLESKNLDPWIKPGLKTMTPPYYVFVGRFNKKEEAYKFGKVLMDELPWINEYTVKEVLLDYDAVLRETRSLN